MILVYTIFKFLHIFLVIVAVGFNISYSIWLARAAKQPENLDFALKGIQTLDGKFANPCYVGLLLTGLAMVFTVGIPLTTFWIAAAIVLWIVAMIGGYGFYTPTLRKQIATLEKDGPESAEFKALSSRGQMLGIFLGVVVVIIIFLMVFKPNPFGV